jgi:hypothetical protein
MNLAAGPPSDPGPAHVAPVNPANNANTPTVSAASLANPLIVATGTTVVLTGQLSLTQSVTIEQGGTLEIEGAGSRATLNGPIQGGGAVVVGQGATLAITSSNNVFFGTALNQGGTLFLEGTNSLVSANGTLLINLATASVQQLEPTSTVGALTTPAANAMTPLIGAGGPSGIQVPQPAMLLQLVGGSGEEFTYTLRLPLKLTNVPDRATVTEGQTIAFTAQAEYGDRTASSVVFSIEPVEDASFPEGASIDPATGAFAWTPTAGFYAFRVVARDGDDVVSQVIHLRVEESPVDRVWTLPTEDFLGMSEATVLIDPIPDDVVRAVVAAPTSMAARASDGAAAAEKPNEVVLAAAVGAVATFTGARWTGWREHATPAVEPVKSLAETKVKGGSQRSSA